MSNLGQHIVTAQNEDANIQLLAAQKEIYSKAKVIFYIQCIFVVPIPIIISVLLNKFSHSVESFLWFFGLYSLIALIAEFGFEEVLSNLKKKAAGIQEKFDCAVLDIPWNSQQVEEKTKSEIIFRYCKKHIQSNSLTDLYNWYSPEVQELPTNLATLVCQRTNCSYDSTQRRKLNGIMLIAAISTFSILFIVSAASGITVPSFIVEILAPSLPVFVLAYKQLSANNKTIRNLDFLRNTIEAILATANITSTVSESIIRQIQDRIYCNRTLSTLLPDALFKKFRKTLEEEMHFSAKEQIGEIKSR